MLNIMQGFDCFIIDDGIVFLITFNVVGMHHLVNLQTAHINMLLARCFCVNVKQAADIHDQ